MREALCLREPHAEWVWLLVIDSDIKADPSRRNLLNRSMDAILETDYIVHNETCIGTAKFCEHAWMPLLRKTEDKIVGRGLLLDRDGTDRLKLLTGTLVNYCESFWGLLSDSYNFVVLTSSVAANVFVG